MPNPTEQRGICRQSDRSIIDCIYVYTEGSAAAPVCHDRRSTIGLRRARWIASANASISFACALP